MRGAGAGDRLEYFCLQRDEDGRLRSDGGEAPFAVVEQRALAEVLSGTDGHDGAVAVVQIRCGPF